MSEFGAVLRAFRRTAGLSQEQLAEASGVSVEAIKTLEAGRRRHPRPLTLDLLGDGLGLTNEQRAELVAAGTRVRAMRQIPEQLPDDLQDFSGRDEQVADIEKLFTSGDVRQGVVVVAAIAGMGGIGKTALGVHVAHRVADRFSDGQLYLNLRGFGPGPPMKAADALGRLMSSLGVQVGDSSSSVDELAARYRSALAGRRVLVFLDNAASESQVRPLLPGTSTCAVIVTSRRSLSGLPGATHLALDALLEQEALQLLDQVVSGRRIRSDPLNAKAIVRLCGGLPLALRIAGARLAAQPDSTAAEFAERLRTSRRKLDELALGDVDVRTSIEVSLSGATEQAARAVAAFRLLGLFEGEELDLRVAARLLDLPATETEERLERLVDLHLLETPAPRRYHMHDLVRSFVRETTYELTTDEERVAARVRVLRFYLGMAWRFRSTRFLGPMTTDWKEVDWTEDGENLSYAQYLQWFDEQIDEIISAAARAARGTLDEQVLVARITIGLNPYFTNRRRTYDGVVLSNVAIAAEESVGDPIAKVMLPFDLSVQYMLAGSYAEAIVQITAALAAPRIADYPEMQMMAQAYLADFLERAGRYEAAVGPALRATAAAQEFGDADFEGFCRLVAGRIAGRQSRFADQTREFERAADLARSSADDTDLMMAMTMIGASYREAGRLDEAVVCLEQGRMHGAGAGNDFNAAEIEEELGRTRLALGKVGMAEQHLLVALEIVRGNWQPEARVRRFLGDVLLAAGREGEARIEWQQAFDLLVRHGAPQVTELRALLDGLDG
ncbi:ATP-binding protein [Kribbella sp. NPDC048928]|uniref:ATP-binding protein n=1 Tax=Kribbella sp. NPDC048928 TaxID=3364111 RepID=UPI00371C6BBC